MKKIAITQELLDIANELDNMKLFKEANTLTKIAHLVVAEDYKHEPMVYNPDDANPEWGEELNDKWKTTLKVGGHIFGNVD
jgi:hypothetical protein